MNAGIIKQDQRESTPVAAFFYYLSYKDFFSESEKIIPVKSGKIYLPRKNYNKDIVTNGSLSFY